MPTGSTSKPPPLLLVGIGLIVLGAIGPWVTIDSDAFGTAVPGLDTSESGLESDGVITLILALIAAGSMLFISKMTVKRIVVGICAVLILVIAIIDVLDVTGTEVLGIEPSVGWGLWLTLVGAIVLDAAVIMTFMRREQPATVGV